MGNHTGIGFLKLLKKAKETFMVVCEAFKTLLNDINATKAQKETMLMFWIRLKRLHEITNLVS